MANPFTSGMMITMGGLVAATTAFGWFSTSRIQHAGDWLPDIPAKIGVWEGVDTPLPPETLRTLGGATGTGREYNTAFNEPVRVSLIAANSFEAYHDPTVCVTGGGFTLTSKKNFPIDGPGSGEVRAMIFKRKTAEYGDVRILMYYWQQNKSGTTATDAVMGNYRDVQARFNTGFGAVVKGNQTILVRIYAPLGPDDVNGAQTQRNVHEIARAVYRSLVKSGKDE